jgi:hypothetical protein
MQRLRCGDDDPDAVRASMREPDTEGWVGAVLGEEKMGAIYSPVRKRRISASDVKNARWFVGFDEIVAPALCSVMGSTERR